MRIEPPSTTLLDSIRTTRNRNIRIALTTSVVARMSGVLLQVISLPMAAVQLGPAGFSIYAMLGAILAALTLSNLGMSQSTTLHMSRASAAGDQKTEREILAISLAIVGGISLAVSALTAALVTFSPLLSFIFSQNIKYTSEPVTAALFICFVFLATQVLSVLEAAQLAQQRQHRLNIAISIGTLIAAGSVWSVASTAPSVAGILVALHLPVIMARMVNAAIVWADFRIHTRELIPALRHARSVLRDGLHFISGATVANFLCHPFSVLAVGMYATPATSASYAAVMNGIILASSVLGVIVTPLRGALPEAYARGDHHWVRYAMKRALGMNLAYGLFIGILLGAYGSWVFDLWYGGAITPGRLELLGAGMYFVLLAVEVTNFNFLSCVGYLSDAARWLMIKSIFAASGILLASAVGQVSLVFWILIAVTLSFSLLPLGFIALKMTPIVSKDPHG